MKLELDVNSPQNALSNNHSAANGANHDSAEIKDALRQGIALAKEGNRTESRQMLLRVTKAEPNNETAWLWLASISEYPEELLVFLQNVLNINPANERAIEWARATKSLLSKTFVQRGINASHENQKEFGKQCFLQAIVHDAGNEMAWLWLASVSDSTEEKMSHLQKVLNINPNNETALSSLKAVKNQTAQALLKKANSAAIAGERESAREMLSEVMRQMPELEEAWILQAYLMDEFYAKIACYEKVLTINPENEAAQAGLTSLKTMMQKTAELKADLFSGPSESAEDQTEVENSPEMSEFPAPNIVDEVPAAAMEELVAEFTATEPVMEAPAFEAVSAPEAAPEVTEVVETSEAVAAPEAFQAVETVAENGHYQGHDSFATETVVSQAPEDFPVSESYDFSEEPSKAEVEPAAAFEPQNETVEQQTEGYGVHDTYVPNRESEAWKTVSEQNDIFPIFTSIPPEASFEAAPEGLAVENRAAPVDEPGYSHESIADAFVKDGPTQELEEETVAAAERQMAELAPAEAPMMDPVMDDEQNVPAPSNFEPVAYHSEAVQESKDFDLVPEAEKEILEEVSAQPAFETPDQVEDFTAVSPSEDFSVDAAQMSVEAPAQMEMAEPEQPKDFQMSYDPEDYFAANLPHRSFGESESNSSENLAPFNAEASPATTENTEAHFDNSPVAEAPVELPVAEYRVADEHHVSEESILEEQVFEPEIHETTAPHAFDADAASVSQAPQVTLFNCPFCAAENESQSIICHSCRAMLSLSDLEMLLAHQEANQDLIMGAIERLEIEKNLQGFDAEDLKVLGIAHLNAKSLRKGFSYLHEASQLNPNDVVLSSKVNFLAIRLSEIEEQENRAQENPVISKTIMVVDDSPTVRKLITGKLEKCGHTVISAVDGMDALAKINEAIPDLILLDITMPRLDGYQVCKLIRNNEVTKDLPVVMISGKDGFFDKVRGRMAGSTGYITKPFGPDTLMKTIETYIN